MARFEVRVPPSVQLDFARTLHRIAKSSVSDASAARYAVAARLEHLAEFTYARRDVFWVEGPNQPGMTYEDRVSGFRITFRLTEKFLVVTGIDRQ